MPGCAYKKFHSMLVCVVAKILIMVAWYTFSYILSRDATIKKNKFQKDKMLYDSTWDTSKAVKPVEAEKTLVRQERGWKEKGELLL